MVKKRCIIVLIAQHKITFFKRVINRYFIYGQNIKNTHNYAESTKKKVLFSCIRLITFVITLSGWQWGDITSEQRTTNKRSNVCVYESYMPQRAAKGKLL